MIFLHHRRRKQGCRVKLCGKYKKSGGGSAYLHELHGIKRQAASDERWDLRKTDRFGEEPLTPETLISADDGFDIVFVDGRILITDSIPIRSILISADDGMLVQQGYPVIRNEGRKQKGVRFSARRAPDTADPERMDAIRKNDAPCVVSMDGQTGRMSAGACQTMELEAVYDGIVIIL